MNESCGIRGYMLRQDFFVDFQIEISEKVDAYRMAHDIGFQQRRAERMVLNAPTERAIPPSCETTVGKVENAVTEFENRFNNFFWAQGFLAAMTETEEESAGEPWPQLPPELQAVEQEMNAQVDAILKDLPEEESQRGWRYFQLRRQDIEDGAGYRFLYGYEYAFCILESTGRRLDTIRLDRIYACLGLNPIDE
ncbi:MAG: hypothetical protein HFF79_08280 [Oscillospiraceae bacterium]|nr:hypothetical protein [Oscillospiraceae bacterium]